MTTKVAVKELNGLNMEILGETVEAIRNDPDLAKCKFRARNKWVGGSQNRSTISGFYAAKQEMTHKQDFHFLADEPPMLAGSDEGANPVEYLLTALAGCVTTGMVAHAAVQGIEIEELESELEGDIDLRGFLGLDPSIPMGYTNIRLNFKVKTDPQNLKKLKRLAMFSPVYNTLVQGTKVDLNIDPL